MIDFLSIKAKLMNVLQINTMNIHFMFVIAQSHTTKIGLSLKSTNTFCVRKLLLHFFFREKKSSHSKIEVTVEPLHVFIQGPNQHGDALIFLGIDKCKSCLIFLI